MPRADTIPEELSSSVAQYVNGGNPSQVEREARAERLAKFLTQPNSHVPTKYVVLWVVLAFLLGTQWRVFLAAFHS